MHGRVGLRQVVVPAALPQFAKTMNKRDVILMACFKRFRFSAVRATSRNNLILICTRR